MPLTPAERQARHRAKLAAQATEPKVPSTGPTVDVDVLGDVDAFLQHVLAVKDPRAYQAAVIVDDLSDLQRTVAEQAADKRADDGLRVPGQAGPVRLEIPATARATQAVGALRAVVADLPDVAPTRVVIGIRAARAIVKAARLVREPIYTWEAFYTEIALAQETQESDR